MKFQVITAEGRGLRHSLLQLVDVTVIGVSLSSVRFARLFPLFIPQNVRNTHSDFALPLDINSFYSSFHPGGLVSTDGHFKTYIARAIRKSGEIRFSNMMFMNLSQYYNAQTTGYNRVPVACRIMVASSISYNQATILFLQCKTNIIWQRIYN